MNCENLVTEKLCRFGARQNATEITGNDWDYMVGRTHQMEPNKIYEVSFTWIPHEVLMSSSCWGPLIVEMQTKSKPMETSFWNRGI